MTLRTTSLKRQRQVWALLALVGLGAYVALVRAFDLGEPLRFFGPRQLRVLLPLAILLRILARECRWDGVVRQQPAPAARETAAPTEAKEVAPPAAASPTPAPQLQPAEEPHEPQETFEPFGTHEPHEPHEPHEAFEAFEPHEPHGSEGSEGSADELWNRAREMIHNFIPDPHHDAEYLHLVHSAAERGNVPALAKLGEYAFRRGALVEAYFWTKMARRRLELTDNANTRWLQEIGDMLRSIRREWTVSGLPLQFENAYANFPEERGELARAFLLIDTGRESEAARAYVQHLAEKGNPDAALFAASPTRDSDEEKTTGRGRAEKSADALRAMLTAALALGWVAVGAADDKGPDDLKAFEERALDADGRPPELRMEGVERYSTNRLTFALNNGLAMTRGGRIWASWISGGDGPESFTVANWSDDGGETWTDAKLVIDGHDGSNAERTNIIGTFWLDPDGNLRCYTDQSVLHFDGRAGVWEAVCENPDDARPVWSRARRIGNGHVMNKPIVLRNGDWAMPAYLNGTWRGHGSRRGAFASLDAERGATCFVSSDRGKTWQRRGTAKFPAERRQEGPVEDWQESQLVELKDGTLRMFARVVDGNVGCLMAADSTDGGRTFGASRRLAAMDNTNARFQIQRLKSGRLVFVKHGVPDAFSMAWRGRRQLTAYLSDDEGKSWKGGLVLDWDGGSYPDLFQAPDGCVYVSHDHGRSTTAEIWLHRFAEEDILARRIVSPKGRLNALVMRAMQSKHNRRKYGSKKE